MNNTTYSVKKSEIERKWYIIDAEGKSLGRVAAEAAKLLRGKHKPTFTPNMDNGDHVIIINCAKAVLTGKKLNQKVYTHFTGYIGSINYNISIYFAVLAFIMSFVCIGIEILNEINIDFVKDYVTFVCILRAIINGLIQKIIII